MIDIHHRLIKILAGAKRIDVLENKVTRDPKVSILVQTYNHHLTITQCLKGILLQKTDF